MRKSLKFLEKTIVTPVQIVVVFYFCFFYSVFVLEKSQKCDFDLAKEASP